MISMQYFSIETGLLHKFTVNSDRYIDDLIAKSSSDNVIFCHWKQKYLMRIYEYMSTHLKAWCRKSPFWCLKHA